MNNLIMNIIKTGRIADPQWSPFVTMTKLSEEAGELAEAVIIQQGQSTYKTLSHEDQVFEEAMDTLIVAVDVVTKAYRNTGMTDEDIYNKLLTQGNLKIAKWMRICHK